MTALSWIFGSKKKDEKASVTVEAIEVGSDEDYAIIQANSHPSLYPQVPTAYGHTYTPLPYSVVPQQNVSQPVVNNVRTNVQNQLEGVPFVLSPSLEQGSSRSAVGGIEDLRRAVFQIVADINDPMFDYDFKLEHNILQEASAYTVDN